MHINHFGYQNVCLKENMTNADCWWSRNWGRHVGRASGETATPFRPTFVGVAFLTLSLGLKGALNPNFLNLTINREKFWL